MRILGELNDIEVIRLGAHLFETLDGKEEYWEKHKEILEPVAAQLESSSQELDKATLHDSYDKHLAQLGLLGVRYRIDSRTKQPEFNSYTGAQEVQGHELTSLGRLLLRQVGIVKDDAG